VLGIIIVGYMLPWIAGPPPAPARFNNHASAAQHQAFVNDAVSNLVLTGEVQAVTAPPFLVSPLGVVPKGEDKLRLILDLRYLNSFFRITPFKYKSIRAVADLCQLGDSLFTVDLKSGYQHIDIHEDYSQYLEFEWEGQYYVFTQLPFNLATACYVFTKVMRQLVKLWCTRGIRTIAYIDNFLFACRTTAEFSRVQTSILSDLATAGLIIFRKKVSAFLQPRSQVFGLRH
jgi:hypothetical protein